MNSIFKLITTEAWEEARLTGLIPLCSADQEAGCILVNQFNDLEKVCEHYFKPSDYPIALEFSPDSYPGLLEWREPSEEKPWKEGLLSAEQLMADLVLNIYGFEVISDDKNERFRIQGE